MKKLLISLAVTSALGLTGCGGDSLNDIKQDAANNDQVLVPASRAGRTLPVKLTLKLPLAFATALLLMLGAALYGIQALRTLRVALAHLMTPEQGVGEISGRLHGNKFPLWCRHGRHTPTNSQSFESA